MFYKILKITISTIIILLVIFGIKNIIFAQNSDDLLVSSNEAGIDSSADREILSLLLELRSINLNDELFQSNIFNSLKDFGVELEPQPVGRDNPFAPIGVDKITDDNINIESDL